MGNAQNETQQNDATQNETPQSNATSNNGNSNPIHSWIRRHPILSIILFVILFIIIINIATSENSPRSRCESTCNDLYTQDSDVWRFCMSSCKDMRSE